MYEKGIAKKDLECSTCGKLLSKGSKCYIIIEEHRVICPRCKPEYVMAV